jgi:glucose-1-phosphate thymidylyltransferase
MRLAYLMMGPPFGAPYTLDQAYPFAGDALVALGFPDIIFEPRDVYGSLLEHQRAAKADVVLGLFPATDPRKTDMVEVAGGGRVLRLEIKPPRSQLRHTWGLAVWTPAFTRFLHEHLAVLPRPPARGELFVGDVIQAAIESGLRVEGIHLSDEPYIDIGTPENLALAVRRWAEPG